MACGAGPGRPCATPLPARRLAGRCGRAGAPVDLGPGGGGRRRPWRGGERRADLHPARRRLARGPGAVAGGGAAGRRQRAGGRGRGVGKRRRRGRCRPDAQGQPGRDLRPAAADPGAGRPGNGGGRAAGDRRRRTACWTGSRRRAARVPACWSSGWNRRRGGRAWPRCWRSAIRWGRQGWRPPIRPAAPAWWRSRTCARPSRDRRRAPRAPRSTRSRELTRWPSSAISTARWAPWSAPGRWRWSCTRRSGWVGAVAGPAGHLGRALVLVSLAIPSGYLIASVVAPTAWVAWLVLGLAAAGVLTFAAWRLARPGGARGWAAPALLGALLTVLVVLDLLGGGEALSRPLLGNSAFDGERFYGLGNGYFAHALAGIFLVVAFRRLPAWAVGALLAGLAVVDGLPGLGADVGGALTAMLSAAAALLLLGRARPSPTRVLWLSVAAVVAAAGIVVGVALLLGETTHGSRAAQDLGSDPGAALRAVGHQLGGNFGLLATNFWAWWGPLLVAFAGLSSVRPPALLAGVPEWVRRVVGVGAIGSALLILLNDTGVTAAAGSGLALVMTLAWSALEPTPYLRTPRSVRR